MFTAHGSINFFKKTLIKFNPFHCIQNNNNNNFIHFIFDMKIQYQNSQYTDKWNKVK